MNGQVRRRIRREVSRQFQFERVSLFRVEKEEKLHREIAKDRERLFYAFKERCGTDGLELANCLKRLVINFSIFASYRGILKGHRMFKLGRSLGEHKALEYIIRYLAKHPDSTDRKICSHLDGKNHGLYKLNRLNKDGPLWANLPRKWKVEMKKQGVSVYIDSAWCTALTHIPGRVMTYLSRARKKANDKHVEEAIFIWPRVIAEHRKRRKGLRLRQRSERD
jgi:hypothetical protein